MKKWLSLIVVAMALLAAVPASAGKVGFVEVERAAASVKEGRQAIAEIEKWAVPRQKRLDDLRKAAEEAGKTFMRQRGVASGDALEQLQKEAVDAKRRFEDAVREFERQYDAKRREKLAGVAHKMNKVVSDYAAANGYDSVFIFRDGMLIYLADSVNLTDTIIGLYDQRFPVEKKLRSGK